MQLKKQQLEPDMEQWTGSKLGKEYDKAVYCYPAHLTYIQSTSWEMLGWKKHKLESRLLGEISITSDMQMTPPLWQSEEELKSLLMKVKEQWKAGLKLKIQKTNMASSTISSVEFSCSVVSDSLWPHESQHARLPCPTPTPRVHSNSCPSSRWCHPAISFSAVPFSSCPQFLLASGSSGQSIGVSASASVLTKNIQDWFPLGWTGWISLQSKGFSRVFSSSKASILWHSAFFMV